MGKSHSKRNKKKTRGELVVQDCLNPKAKNVTYHNVQMGCTIYGADAQPSTSKIHNKKDEDDDIRTSKCDDEKAAITSTLKNLYEKIAIPCLPWIKETYVSMKYFTKLQLNSDNEQSTTKDIKLHNLFDAVNKKNPRRILIEAQPGFGKTTLAHKIISDWVNEESYVKRFKFAFLIILRNYKSSTLKDEIFEIIGVGNGAEEETWRIINSEETLLIFDGLDEVSENVKNDIFEILFDKQNVFKMTIVVTCRAGSPQLKKDDSKFRGVSMRNEFWSKKITILGINREDEKQFLNNFVDDENKDKIMPRLMEIVYSRRKMFKSPLMLILLAYVTREDHEIKIEKNTDLYKQFADCIIRRSIAKNNPAKASADFTLFDSSVNEYSSTFYKFGEMCWEHILNDELQFDSNADTEAIHQLGFLLKHETNKKFAIFVHYEGFHLSMLEFAAAVFLKKEFQDNHNRFCDSLIEKIVEICVQKGFSSLVILFLFGLLGNQVSSFFEQLSDCHIKYWVKDSLIEYILRECEMDESIIESVQKIVPPFINVNLYTSSQDTLLDVINQYSPKFPMDVIFMDDIQLCLLQLQPVRARVLICCVNRDYIIFDADDFKIGENITCDYLTFKISDVAYEGFISGLKMFEKISSRYKSLHIDGISKEIQTHLQKSDWQEMIRGAQFDLLVKISGNDEEIEVIEEIIKFNLVSNVCLVTRSEDKVYRSLGNTNILTSLCIINEDCYTNLNFDTIAENAGKKCECLLFSNIKLECKTQHNSNRHIKSLSINADKHNSSLIHDANVMLSVVPTTLRCKSRALEVLNNNPHSSSWTGWDVIVELSLTIGELTSEQCERDFNYFSRFKKLKILTLEFLEKRDDKLDVTDIVESISFLALDRLEIRWLNIDYYEVIIRGIQTLILRNKISRVNAIRLAIVWDHKKIYCDHRFNLELIKSALQCDGRISFTFYFEDWSILQECIQKCIPELLYFDVKYAFIANILARYNLLSSFPGHYDPPGIHKLDLTLR